MFSQHHKLSYMIQREKSDPSPTENQQSSRFLLLRFGLHLGLRQKNLRQLRLCPQGHHPTAERRLEEMKCGELRWSEREQG